MGKQCNILVIGLGVFLLTELSVCDLLENLLAQAICARSKVQRYIFARTGTKVYYYRCSCIVYLLTALAASPSDVRCPLFMLDISHVIHSTAEYKKF
jgi:hypothetical protein